MDQNGQLAACKVDKCGRQHADERQHAADEKSILSNLQNGITKVARKKVFQRKKTAIMDYVKEEMAKFTLKAMQKNSQK